MLIKLAVTLNNLTCCDGAVPKGTYLLSKEYPRSLFGPDCSYLTSDYRELQRHDYKDHQIRMADVEIPEIPISKIQIYLDVSFEIDKEPRIHGYVSIRYCIFLSDNRLLTIRSLDDGWLQGYLSADKFTQEELIGIYFSMIKHQEAIHELIEQTMDAANFDTTLDCGNVKLS